VSQRRNSSTTFPLADRNALFAEQLSQLFILPHARCASETIGTILGQLFYNDQRSKLNSANAAIGDGPFAATTRVM
jgi:hypothetical protein